MKYIEARTLHDALTELNSDCTLTPISGGTDIIIQWRDGKTVEGFLDINRITQLKGIIERKGWITMGSATTHTEIAENKIIQQMLPALSIACSKVGSIAIRNKGTIGGNIMNASPASDSAPALLAYNASLFFENHRDIREIPIADFYLDYKKTNYCAEELLTKIMIPPTLPDEISEFHKLGNRKSVSIAKINACFRIKTDENGVIKLIRIAFGSIAPTPIRLKNIEDLLFGNKLHDSIINDAVKLLENTIKPIDDIRSTKDYRLHIAKFWLKNFLERNRKE